MTVLTPKCTPCKARPIGSLAELREHRCGSSVKSQTAFVCCVPVPMDQKVYARIVSSHEHSIVIGAAAVV